MSSRLAAAAAGARGADRSHSNSFPNEIIEFPVVLLQWKKLSPPSPFTAEDEEPAEWTLEVVDEFQSFVRPTWRPRLSAFCTELTGITQVSSSCSSTSDKAVLMRKESAGPGGRSADVP